MQTMAPKIGAVILCLILGVLSFTGRLDSLTDKAGNQRLARHNEEYLSASFNKALIGFGVMSVLKAGLDIIEGSELGASFGVTAQLQVGDIVQPAYDYVDIAWRTLLTSCVTLLSIRYLLKAAQIVDHYVLGVTLILVACFLGILWWRRNWTRTRSLLRDILGIAVVATLALYYILPLSVWSASKLSRTITQPALEEAQKGFEETKNILFPEDQQQVGGVVAKLKYMQDRIQHIASYLKDKSKDMVIWTIKLITGYLFDCIVFPLTLFAVLLWLIRAIIRYLFEKGLQASLRDDLAQILTEARGRSNLR